MALIIDDGLPARKHRQNIFNPNLQLCGRGLRTPRAVRDDVQHGFRRRLCRARPIARRHARRAEFLTGSSRRKGRSRLLIAALPLRAHLVQDRLDRRVRFQQGRAHHFAEFAPGLAQSFRAPPAPPDRPSPSGARPSASRGLPQSGWPSARGVRSGTGAVGLSVRAAEPGGWARIASAPASVGTRRKINFAFIFG